MATMNQRATFALDTDTTLAIRELAGRWQVSQAEVIRRSVRLAAEQLAREEPSTPAEVVAYYQQRTPTRSWDDALALAAQLGEERHADDEDRLQKLSSP